MAKVSEQNDRDKVTAIAWKTLFGLSCLHFFASMDRYAFNILMEPIKADLNASDTQMGLLSGLAFVVCYLLFGIPIARWVDTGVRKTILIGSLAIWSIVTMFTSTASSVFQMGFFRAALGTTESGALPASLSMLSDSFPKKHRHKAVSIFQLGAGISPIIGVPVIAVLSDMYGWRVALIALGLAGLTLAAVLAKTIKEPQRGQYDDVESKKLNPGSLWNCLIFVLKNRGLVFHIISHIWITSGVTIFLVWAAAYKMRVLELSLSQAGFLTSVSGVLIVVGILSGGWICSKLVSVKQDDRWVAGFCAIVSVIAIVGLAVTFTTSNIFVFISAYSLCGFMLFGRVAPAMTLSTDLVPPGMRGLSSSLTIGLSSLFGAGIAPLLSGMLSDSLAATHGSAEGLRLAILYSTISCIAVGAFFGLLSVLTIKPLTSTHQTTEAQANA